MQGNPLISIFPELINFNVKSGGGNYLPFRGCTRLQYVNLEKFTTLNYAGFQNTQLRYMYLPNATIISNFSINAMAKLKWVEMFKVTTVQNDFFRDCGAIEKLIMHMTTPPTVSNTLTHIANNKNLKIYVPDDCVDTYKAANMWNASNVANKIYPLSELLDENTWKWLYPNLEPYG